MCCIVKKKKFEPFDLEPWKHSSYLSTINLKLRFPTGIDHHSKQADLLKYTQFFLKDRHQEHIKKSRAPRCISGVIFLDYKQYFDVLVSVTSKRKSPSE